MWIIKKWLETHFGTSPIKDWIESGEWKMNYPNFLQYSVILIKRNRRSLS